MKRALIAFGFATLFAFSGSAADVAALPPNIIEHSAWCAKAKDTAALINRYEGFWSRYHPKNEEYQDAIDVRFVRLCAYRLAALYAVSNDRKKCREMLLWLEAEDQAFLK